MKRHAPSLSVLLVVLAALTCAGGAPPRHTIDTLHYTIHSDLDPDLTRDLGRRLDAMHAEYARRLSDFPPRLPHGRLEVHLFARRADYQAFTGSRFPNTAGIFMSGRNVLAAFLEGQGRDMLRRTLQHEAFHQFAHLHVGEGLPVWLNEGLAQVFEEGLWTGEAFLLGQAPPHRIRQLRDDMANRRLLRFEDLMAMDDAAWHAGLRDRARSAVLYNQAWAMAHFLVYATDARGRPVHRARLLEMLRLIRDGRGADSAFREAFSTNIAGFERRFIEYARALRPTAEAAYIERQTVLADLLVTLRGEGAGFDDIAALRSHLVGGGYRVTYRRGTVQWTTDPDPATYFRSLSGRALDDGELFLLPRHGAPLPDLVARVLPGLQFRTRFYGHATVDYEVLVEPR